MDQGDIGAYPADAASPLTTWAAFLFTLLTPSEDSMRVIVLAVILASITSIAAASPTLTPEDLNKMTPAQLDKLDVYAVMRVAFQPAQQSTPRLNADALITSMVKSNMAILLYPVDSGVLRSPDDDPKFREQIMELQTTMGVPPTGTLLKEEFDRLSRAAATLHERKVYPPPGNYVLAAGSDRIDASGTWVMDDDAFPVNYSQITCMKASRTCSQASVDVSKPDIFPSDHDFNLSLSITNYAITSWDTNEVTAEADSSCRRTKLTINTSTKQAFLLMTDRSSEGCKLTTGVQLPLLGKPRIATLGDGFLEAKKFYDARTQEAGKLVYRQFPKELGLPSNAKPTRSFLRDRPTASRRSSLHDASGRPRLPGAS